MSGSWIVGRGSWVVDRRSRIAVFIGCVALAACGEAPDEAEDASDSGTVKAGAVMEADAEADALVTVDGVSVRGPWVRVAIMPEGSDAPDAPPVNSAAYMVVTNANAAADALVAVETEVADTAEIHSVTMDEGVMRMRPADSLPVPAGGEAVLEQGGYHIMLIGLRTPLAEGDTVPLRLRFRSGTVIDLAAPVLRSPSQM